MRKSDVMILVEGVGPAIASLIGKGMESLRARLEETEKQLAAVMKAFEARPDVQGLVDAAVAKALAERDAVPEWAGLLRQDIDGACKALKELPETTTPMRVAEMIDDAFQDRGPPKDGKDADPEVIASLVKDGLAAAMGPVLQTVDRAVAEVRAASQAAVDEMKADHEKAIADLPKVPSAEDVAALVAPGKDGESVTVEQLQPVLAGLVTEGLESIRAGAEASIEKAVAALPTIPTAAEVAALVPAGKDGSSVALDDVRPLVAEAVNPSMLNAMILEVVKALPPAPADLEAVRDAVFDEVTAQVGALPPIPTAEAVAALVPAGKDATPEAIEAAAAKVLATWERPKDGKSITLEEVLPPMQERLEKLVAALPVAKDGVGLAGALIDSDGILVATLTDGSLHKLGPVRGEKGLDGLGFDNLEVIDQGLTFVLRFSKGDQVKEFVLAKPTLGDGYRGVWKPGAFKKGEAVTWGGSLFIAQADTEAKPETSDDWRLAVKRGRDGKDAEPKAPKPPATVKL